MILADVNVLVYALHADATEHAAYAPWLVETLEGGTAIAVCESTVTGLVRIVTNPKIFSDPTTASRAADAIDAIGATWLAPTGATWAAFRRILQRDRLIRANLVPDAWLAAVAISHGCRLATADRGFARFEGLDWFDPAA
jgi:toxin-antitoxin system PIN domain toxin